MEPHLKKTKFYERKLQDFVSSPSVIQVCYTKLTGKKKVFNIQELREFCTSQFFLKSFSISLCSLQSFAAEQGWGRIKSSCTGIWSFFPFYSQIFHIFGTHCLQIMLSIWFCLEFTFPMLQFLLVCGGKSFEIASYATDIALANWDF